MTIIIKEKYYVERKGNMMKKTLALLCLVILLLPLTHASTTKNGSDQELLSLPPSFSWRNINGTDSTTPIKYQSPAPTCEAYALCAALETKMQYPLQELYNPDLSDNHL